MGTVGSWDGEAGGETGGAEEDDSCDTEGGEDGGGRELTAQDQPLARAKVKAGDHRVEPERHPTTTESSWSQATVESSLKCPRPGSGHRRKYYQ